MDPKRIQKIAIQALYYANQGVILGDNILSEQNVLASIDSTKDFKPTVVSRRKDEIVQQLGKGVDDVREQLIDPNELKADENHSLRIDPSNQIYAFDYNNNIVNKYSLGNCEDLSSLALTKLLELAPELNIELFHMTDGDHVFIVINRPKNSDANNPLSWGDDCIICDPFAWMAYPASQAVSHLKTYDRGSYLGGHYMRPVFTKNKDGSIDQEYKMEPMKDYNIKALAERNSTPYKNEMVQMYKSKLDILLQSSLAFKKDLVKIRSELTKGTDSYKSMTQKLAEVESVINKIKNEKRKGIPVANYHKMKSSMTTELLACKNLVVNASRFEESHIKNLKEFELKNRNKRFSKLYRFFNHDSSKPYTLLVKGLTKLRDNVNRLNDLPVEIAERNSKLISNRKTV